MGNHIDVQSQKWVAQDAGIGAGVDSYFEYLVKGAIMLQDEELLNMFLGNTHMFLSHTHNLTLGKGLHHECMFLRHHCDFVRIRPSNPELHPL